VGTATAVEPIAGAESALTVEPTAAAAAELAAATAEVPAITAPKPTAGVFEPVITLAEAFTFPESAVTAAESPIFATEVLEPTVETIEAIMEAEPAADKEAPVIGWVRIIEVVPGAGPDEDAIRKPFRSPITVRSAPKRIVGVIAVRTDGWRIVQPVARTDLHANGNLGVRIRRGEHQNSEYNKILEIPHVEPPHRIRHLFDPSFICADSRKPAPYR
jgi:hypothetical protein